MDQQLIGKKVKILCHADGDHNIGDVGIVTGMSNDLAYPITIEVPGKSSYGVYSLLEIELVDDADGWVEGAKLINEYGMTRLILGVCGAVIFPSFESDHTRAGSPYTKDELVRSGWKLKASQPETIEIDGKKYEREAVAERLKELPTVD